ncbi:uncharacterized protein LOC133886901 [Phragmites australis]|uniref:uncharacterized protein LOC133886901 n=1 Tax=Phragmites australis TaxID=29695 RepID=UPI002D76D4AA|nr:uncharacterized protein LOC133886901 [Phragmites australis]
MAAPPSVGVKGEGMEMDNGVLPAVKTIAGNGDPSAVDRSATTEEVTTNEAGAQVLTNGNAKGGNSSSSGSVATEPKVSKPPARGAVSKKLTPARAAFALFTSLALWFSADQPRRAVWTFSVIASSYLALWTISLTATIHAGTVLVSVSYMALVAAAVTHLSSSAGIFIMLLDTAYAAGLFGYALSDYRQRKGTERSAEAVPTRSEDDLKWDRGVFCMVSFYATVTSLVCAAGAAWVIYYTVDEYWIVLLLSILIDLSLFLWACLVAVQKLHGALITDNQMGFIYWSGVLLFLPDFLLSYLFGEAIGVLVHPLGMIGMAGFLGYSLGVHARYEHMVTLEKKEA